MGQFWMGLLQKSNLNAYFILSAQMLVRLTDIYCTICHQLWSAISDSKNAEVQKQTAAAAYFQVTAFF